LDLRHQDALVMARDELQKMLATLRRSAYRLERLVENLLDAGSIEAGTFQIRAKPTSLRAAVQDALSFVEPMLEGKVQKLVTQIAPGADRVLADPRRTSQVLSNLIANASKYAPEETRITLASWQAEGFIEVVVIDQGTGIPLDEQPRISQPFYI